MPLCSRASKETHELGTASSSMIPAQKWPLFDAWFCRHALKRLARSFHALNVHGLAETKSIAQDAPVLVVSNHTSWHDPLVVLALGRALDVDAYAMMDAKNLEKLPFFRRVGAFGVHLDDARDGARALRYGAGLLDRPRRVVWIFPQGKTCPVTEPLVFRGGSARIAKLAKGCRIVPMAVRYDHADDELPSAWVSFGAPVESTERDAGVVTALHKTAVEQELLRIEGAVRARSRGDAFSPLFQAKAPWFGTMAERALGWLAG